MVSRQDHGKLMCWVFGWSSLEASNYSEEFIVPLERLRGILEEHVVTKMIFIVEGHERVFGDIVTAWIFALFLFPLIFLDFWSDLRFRGYVVLKLGKIMSS